MRGRPAGGPGAHRGCEPRIRHGRRCSPRLPPSAVTSKDPAVGKLPDGTARRCARPTPDRRTTRSLGRPACRPRRARGRADGTALVFHDGVASPIWTVVPYGRLRLRSAAWGVPRRDEHRAAGRHVHARRFAAVAVTRAGRIVFLSRGERADTSGDGRRSPVGVSAPTPSGEASWCPASGALFASELSAAGRAEPRSVKPTRATVISPLTRCRGSSAAGRARSPALRLAITIPVALRVGAAKKSPFHADDVAAPLTPFSAGHVSVPRRPLFESAVPS